MNLSNRPNLSLDIEYQIEIAKNQIHVHYWPRLERMQELTQDARSQYRILKRSLAPPSPKSPQALRLVLHQYASSLFESEAAHFPDDQELEHWLKKLSENIVGGILQRVAQVEDDGRSRYVTLDYHGLTKEEMIKAIRQGTHEATNRRLGLLKRREKEQEVYAETARHLMAVREVEKRLEPQRPQRLPSTIMSISAARKVEAYIVQNGIGLTEFATRAGTTDRTLRTFRRTGKVRRSIFEQIAKAMGTTKELLLKD